MAGNRSRRRELQRNIEKWFNGREDRSVSNNDVERNRKMINHRINGWSSAFDDDPKKHKRMRLWLIIALLMGSAAYFTFDYVKSNSSNSFSEAEKSVKTEEVTKDSTSTIETKKEVKYSTDEEALIERPVYPKRGFNSAEEAEEFYELLDKYNEQQKRINEWKGRGNTVSIVFRDRRVESYLNSLKEDNILL
jgi:hypothetical protein